MYNSTSYLVTVHILQSEQLRLTAVISEATTAERTPRKCLLVTVKRVRTHTRMQYY